MPPIPFSLRRRAFYPLLFLALATLVLFSAADKEGWEFKTEHLLAIVVALGAFVHFLYQQHNVGTQTFIHLFEAFNKRYDRLNGRLNQIVDASTEEALTDEEKAALYDYFNLCAEEYLFYDAGYIDDRVWEAWKNGMCHFFSNPRIWSLWEVERRQGSYYGFAAPRSAA